MPYSVAVAAAFALPALATIWLQFAQRISGALLLLFALGLSGLTVFEGMRTRYLTPQMRFHE